MGWNGHCIRVFEESIKAVLWRNPPCCEALYRNTVLWAPRGWYHLRFSKFKQKCSLAYPPYSIWRNGLLFFENQTKVSFGLPSIDGETLRSPGWIFFFVFWQISPLAYPLVWLWKWMALGSFSTAHWRNPPYVRRDSFQNLWRFGCDTVPWNPGFRGFRISPDPVSIWKSLSLLWLQYSRHPRKSQYLFRNYS